MWQLWVTNDLWEMHSATGIQMETWLLAFVFKSMELVFFILVFLNISSYISGNTKDPTLSLCNSALFDKHSR